MAGRAWRRSVAAAAALLLAACAGDLGGRPSSTTDTFGATTSVSTAPATTAAPEPDDTEPDDTDLLDPDDPDPGITNPATGPASGPLGLTDWACPAGSPADAVCHHFGVPVDATEPAGAVVTLPVMVLPARVSPATGTIVVLPDGPGRSGLATLPDWVDSPLRETHDLVLYDQRGTGLAEPALDCIERDNAFVDVLQSAGDPRTEDAAVRYGLIVCRDRHTSAGIDITEYDTEQAARDLAVLRTALGVEQWDVVAQGHGSRAALAAVQANPAGIRSLVLDGVDDRPATFSDDPVAAANSMLPTVVASCAASPACAAAHPDLAAHLAELFARPDDVTIDLVVDVGDGAGDRRLLVERDDLLFGLVLLLTDAVALPTVPSVIDALAAGDTSVVTDLILRAVGTFTARADAVSDTFSGTPDSTIPTLILVGAFDPVTPAARASLVAADLSASTVVAFPNLGHGVVHDTCATTVTQSFLADPASLDLECVASLGPPAWT